ncbi:MAG: hypothetical protein AAF438_22860 [Pseudomonadota bacterium]
MTLQLTKCASRPVESSGQVFSKAKKAASRKRPSFYAFVASMAAASAWPSLLYGHGGIGSLGALVPVFVVLAVLALVLFVWLVLSWSLYATKADRMTRKRIRIYNGYSIFVLILLLAAALAGTQLAGILALLLFLVLMVVLGTTMSISSRAERVLQSLDEGSNKDLENV